MKTDCFLEYCHDCVRSLPQSRGLDPLQQRVVTVVLHHHVHQLHVPGAGVGLLLEELLRPPALTLLLTPWEALATLTS